MISSILMSPEISVIFQKHSYSTQHPFLAQAFFTTAGLNPDSSQCHTASTPVQPQRAQSRKSISPHQAKLPVDEESGCVPKAAAKLDSLTKPLPDAPLLTATGDVPRQIRNLYV